MNQISPDEIIIVKNLTKKFKDFPAVNDISFSVKRSEIFAFLGPNGAGKSTTIKMLITLLQPTSGDALIDEMSVVHNASAVRKKIGYVPQLISVDASLSAYENLMLMARLYDIPRDAQKKRIADVLNLLEMDAHTSALVNTFSGGMIRKVEIGQAILHHPTVLFLDEPTSGLDPIARRNVWKHLIELRDKFSMTIFYSTHYMEEAEDVSDRVAIMHTGKLAVIGTVQELKQQTKKQNATLEDAFIFFTGAQLKETGNFRDIRKARMTEMRRG